MFGGCVTLVKFYDLCLLRRIGTVEKASDGGEGRSEKGCIEIF